MFAYRTPRYAYLRVGRVRIVWHKWISVDVRRIKPALMKAYQAIERRDRKAWCGR
jgi:hypothetical protein